LVELKKELRQNTLPRVQIAISELPAGFFHLFGKEKPSMLVKSVLTAVFAGQRGKVTWQSVLTTCLPLFFAI